MDVQAAPNANPPVPVEAEGDVDVVVVGEEEEEGPLQNPETQVLNAHWVFEVQGALKLPHKLDREEEEE